MATAKEIRAVVRAAVDFAIEEYPNDSGMRARLFTAYLTGRLETLGEDMAADLKRLRNPTSGPAADVDGA